MLVLTAGNMKKAEENAVMNGKDYYSLMERAGICCADVIAKEDKAKKITVLCGKGRNGGDGFVIARKLCEYGFKNIFAVLVYGEPTDELCKMMYGQMLRCPVNIVDMNKNAETAVYHIATADVIADAIFGIGFRGELSGNAAAAVIQANKNNSASKYAIDIPSGLCADGTYDDELFFETDRTLTMIALKPVQVIKPTADFCGETSVMDIGITENELLPFAEKYFALTREEAIKNIRKRHFNSHKGSFGSVLTVCGSYNMTGCVYLCNQAAAEIGAGLVTAAFPDCIYNVAASKLNEPLMMPLPSNKNGRIRTDAKQLLAKFEKTTVVAVGCGIGVDNDTKELVRFIVENAEKTVILDADALNCIAKEPEILKNAKGDIIITPHPGEMARLTGLSVAEIEKDRIGTAISFAEKYGVTVVLKGANTVIADKNGRVCINPTGNPSMSRGGSGDVLTGLVAGLVPQTADGFSACCTACYIHGMTADILARKYGPLSATPTRIVENIHLGIAENNNLA